MSFLHLLFFFSFHSPRDSTGGLGVKMVEYVLGGSPTNKESPLSNMESRLRGLKFNENDKVSQFIEISCSDVEKNNKNNCLLLIHFSLCFQSLSIAKTRRNHHLTLMV